MQLKVIVHQNELLQNLHEAIEGCLAVDLTEFETPISEHEL